MAQPQFLKIKSSASGDLELHNFNSTLPTNATQKSLNVSPDWLGWCKLSISESHLSQKYIVKLRIDAKSVDTLIE